MSKNIHKLSKTKCYLIGAIEYDSSASLWRDEIKNQLHDLNILFLDPTDKPFVEKINEDDVFKANLKKYRERGNHKQLHRIMSQIRREDLSLVDKSDFTIHYLDLDKITCGSWEEWFLSIKIKRPSFLVCKQGISKIPLWCYGCVDSGYFFDNFNDLYELIRGLDSGIIPLDLKRWKLLAPEFR